MKPLLLATRNQGKVREMRTLLLGLGVRIETLASHPEAGEVEETGATVEENDALGGAPGIRSARYAGVHGDDAANCGKLLRELCDAVDRSARYVCSIALATPEGEILASAQGTCEGSIADEPRGKGGFGYDPVFVPERSARHTMAELEPRDKALLSHRGQAMRAFVPLLRVHLEGDAVG